MFGRRGALASLCSAAGVCLDRGPAAPCDRDNPQAPLCSEADPGADRGPGRPAIATIRNLGRSLMTVASLRSGAPFHHLVDSCLRQGRFGSDTFGSTAYLAAKAKGDRSMPSKRGTPEDVYDVAPQDPHDKVKVGLLEPQSPAVYKRTPRYHVCSEDPRDTRFRRTTSEGFHSGERPPYSGGTGRTGHLTRAMTSTKSRRRDRLWGASPRATEPS